MQTPLDQMITLTLPTIYKDIPEVQLAGVMKETLTSTLLWGETLALSIG